MAAQVNTPRYLPKTIGEAAILLHQGGNKWCVDNTELKSGASKIAYRKSKDSNDKDPVLGVLWGTIIEGIEEGDWVKVEVPAPSSVEAEQIGNPTTKAEVPSSVEAATEEVKVELHTESKDGRDVEAAAADNGRVRCFLGQHTQEKRHAFSGPLMPEKENIGQQDYCASLKLAVHLVSKSTFLALVVGIYSMIQSIMSLVIPACKEESTIMGIVIGPLPYFIFFVTGSTFMFFGMENFEEMTANARFWFKFIAVRILIQYSFYVAVRVLLKMFFVGHPWWIFAFEGTLIPAFVSVELYGGIVGRAWRDGCTKWETFFVFVRTTLCFFYVFALSGIILLNFGYLQYTWLNRYMGLVIQAEKGFLSIVKAFCLLQTPCGYPMFLLDLGFHFELDTQMLVALTLVAAPDWWSALLQIALDWVIFLFRVFQVRRSKVMMSFADVEAMPGIIGVFQKVACYFSGVVLMFPKHIFIARGMNFTMASIAQTGAVVWVITTMSISVIMRGDGPPTKYEEFFMPNSEQGLVFLAVMLVSTVLQDFMCHFLLQLKGMKVSIFLDIYTGSWQRMLFSGLMFSFSAWVFNLLAIIGWYFT